MQKSTIVKIGALILIILALSTAGYFGYKKFYKNNIPGKNETQKTDINKNAKTNNTQNAISAAKSTKLEPIKGVEAADHYKGNLDAPVEIIIYEDFECPFCARFFDTVKEIENNFKDKIVIAFRHYILTSHPQALPAALAVECADEQGKFWEMYEKTFEISKAGKLNLENIKQTAAELKLKIEQFNQCLDEQKYLDKIQTQQNDAKKYGVTGTPTIFVNGEVVPGAYPFADFTASDGKPMKGMKSIIEAHLGDKK
jgi:protein-disulfide isomerase